MVKGEISNYPGLTVLVDFDSLLDPPEKKWRQRILSSLSQFPRIEWHLRPYLLRWYSLNHYAKVWAYLVMQYADVTIVVAVRGNNNLIQKQQVKKILGEEELEQYPNVGYFPTSAKNLKQQAAQIEWHSTLAIQAGRFYTKDKALADYLPPSLVKVIDQWENVQGL